ncbi:hypothetical protein EJV22_11255 [Fictibacillus phosphorivorans]|nr:hypothetical protein [Fictibacillus phosphorivorans]
MIINLVLLPSALQVGCSVRLPTPTGRAVRWRLLKARSGRRLTVRPVESEQPGAETNYYQGATIY